MSRIIGDSLVAGPEATRAPEVVTVRLTRGQAEALAKSTLHMCECLDEDGHPNESRYMSGVLASIRAQIGGSR